MANEEHLALLHQGVNAWNKWREENRPSRPDLSGADLVNTHLRGVNFRGVSLAKADAMKADLQEADLFKADLTMARLTAAKLCQASLIGADLTRTDLVLADLSAADLQGAYIHKTNLRQANLTGARLVGAYLIEMDLTGAITTHADLSKAKLSLSVLGNLDLSETRNLDTVDHLNPSTIGIDTIYRSRGRIPEAFLRGAGIPDDLITYVASFVAGNPIQYYSVFISYSSNDQAIAEQLHADLQAKGVRCWFAPHDLKIGDRFRQRIDEAIRIYDKLLLILSDHSVASDWVETEVEAALEKERLRGQTVLFPVRLDDSVSTTSTAWAATLRRTRHIGNFTCWKDQDAYMVAFDRLLRDLKAAPP